LDLPGRVVVVVVETALTDGADFWRVNQRKDAIDAVGGLVRVQPDGGPDMARVGASHVDRLGRLGRVSTYTDHAIDACRGCGLHRVRRRALVLEVTVAVSPHQGASVPLRGPLGALRRGNS